MSRVQTMVQLTEDLVALLDREAARRGVSRSALIRTALEEFLRNDQEAAISRRIVDGYVRIPPETPDEWGDLAETTDRTSLDLLRRLDAEERRQGRAPW
jgi:Arc/MetJ-type ribon-helix-helix transcriptional regulator